LGQSPNEQAPGQEAQAGPGWLIPQLPPSHDPPCPCDTDALNVENNLLIRPAPHFGHFAGASAEVRARCSNVAPHPAQEYSYIGMENSFPSVWLARA